MQNDMNIIENSYSPLALMPLKMSVILLMILILIWLKVYKLFDDFGIIDKNKYLNINNEIKV